MNQDRLDHLKQEYDAIPVPPELEERVRAAIRQATPAGEQPPTSTVPRWRGAGTR